MSTSDQHDTDSSNIESPMSFVDSPYNSPSQQVPHLAYSMTELTCRDGRPYLKIVVEPQNRFRFRYKSEMVGTHGCLLGESYVTSKTKTHPTVELVNYNGRAVIRCRLAQHKTPDEHPHKLLEDEQDRDVSYVVPEQSSYRVGFAGMGIIHTAKKDVPGLLYKKYIDKLNHGKIQAKDLRTYCENEAKNINLNIVRLRFSAHDIITDKEICPPVFSRPIYNMKCAATNDLKICRISRVCGRSTGGDDVFLLVEKVNKKNVIVRLFEINDIGDEVWSANGHFLQSDVHHQYAIVFRTPPYRDPHTPVDKKVFIELLRPSDGCTSEAKEFKYKAAPAFKLGKRRKANSTYSSYSSTDGSLKSTGDVPATVLFMNRPSSEQPNIKDVQMFTIPQIPQIPQPSPLSSSDLGEALYGMTSEGSPSDSHFYDSPMLPQQPVLEPPDLQLNSTELERILKDNLSIPAEEKERFCNTDWSEYLKLYDSVNEENNSFRLNIVRSMLTSDSGRGANVASPSKQHAKAVKGDNTVDKSKSSMEYSEFNRGGHGTDVKQKIETSPLKQHQKDVTEGKTVDKPKTSSEYSAFYSVEHGTEVKKLVKELCEMIREKSGIKKPIVRAKLEKLFDMRLSNGDTFLHMTLCSKQPSLDYIVKLIHSMKMPHLLNKTNHQGQTILHLAITQDIPNIVGFLVSKGCNPMIEDIDGNNAIHNAVIYQSCLSQLLEALKFNKISIDLNAFNNEKQTALHLAVINKSESSARKLLENGASYSARDSEGRTPLHLAAYDDCLDVARTLLEYVVPGEIDALDGRGYTALQVACDGEARQGTLEMVKLLLDKNADPLKHEDSNMSAWYLAKDKQSLRDAMRPYMSGHALLNDEDIKSEPEDDFESADEGEAGGSAASLPELSAYVAGVAAALDASGGWARLAARLDLSSLHSWFVHSGSPTRTLLYHLKETGVNMNSKNLAVILEEIGEKEAANIIRRNIE